LNRATRQNLLHGSWLVLLAALLFFPPLQRGVRNELLELTPPSVNAATVVHVWVYKNSGLYFCSDSTFYGKLKPGFYMVQEKALQTGYQPALHKLCK
jgi:hypothetical protein